MTSFVQRIVNRQFRLTQTLALTVLLLLLLLECGQTVIPVFGQPRWSSTESPNIGAANGIKSKNNTSDVCECIEYWNCTARNGQFYSYCGISEDEVCCYYEKIPVAFPQIGKNETQNKLNQGGNGNSTSDTLVWSPAITSDNAKIRKPCGIASIPGNLDSVAEFREWPWHVGILEAKDDLYICGGSIVSQRHVLTAAHCVTSYLGKNSRLKIRAGEFDVSTNSEASPHVELLVKAVTLHPNFSNSSLINDIALLELVRNIPTRNRDNIALVCLPEENQRNLTIPGRCIVTGWGRPNEQSEHSVRMKEIIVPVWEADQCEKKLRRNFGPSYVLPDSSMCAGDEKKDACDGDGGGPLVCFQNGKWVQQGIVSFGVGCGRPELPGVYTRVSSYVSWIKDSINNG